nr:hypothetical protein [Deltaproteobacteria bacterium]
MSRFAGLLVLLLGTAALADTPEPPPAPAEAPANPPDSAEEAAPAPAPPAPAPRRATADSRSKVPLRVVKILSDSEQALLFDKHRGRHVLVDVGATVGEYTVDAIADDEVTLSSVTLSGKELQIVLAGPEQPWRRDRGAKPVARTATAKPAPADPYAPEDPDPPDAPDAPGDRAPAVGFIGDEDVRAISAAGIEPVDPITAPSATSAAPTTIAPG